MKLLYNYKRDLRGYRDELLTIKSNVQMVKRGDHNFTMSHIPPKSFVCCIFKCSITNLMVYEPHRNKTTTQKD